VPCLTALGDAPRIKRFDEYGHEGVVLQQTYFKSNPYIEKAIAKLINGQSALGMQSQDFTT
jgi:hypothetical protein